MASGSISSMTGLPGIFSQLSSSGSEASAIMVPALVP